MIEKWKLAVKEFLKDYEENDDVIGAMLCGSYANDNQNENSDIDICLILKDEVLSIKRGIKESNSYLIDYFIGYYETFKNYMDEEFELNDFSTINMLAFSKIIYDLTGETKKLQDLALSYIDREISPITSSKLAVNNYQIWKYQNELKTALSEESTNFNLIYYKLLDKILNYYYEYLELPKLPITKAYKILTNEDYKDKFHIFKVPEQEFIRIFALCYEINKPTIMYKNISLLISYYYEKVGGFNIKKFLIENKLN